MTRKGLAIALYYIIFTILFTAMGVGAHRYADLTELRIAVAIVYTIASCVMLLGAFKLYTHIFHRGDDRD